MRLKTPDALILERGPLTAFRRAVGAVSVAGFMMSAAALAYAQTATPSNPADARRQLEDRRQKLSETEKKADALQADLTQLDAERERLNTRLVETAALIQRSEGQMTSIEGRLSELEAQEKVVRGSLEQRYGQISSLLAALQRMGRNPPPVLITRREDALQMVRSAMLLSSAFPELKDKALSLAERLGELQRVMTDIRGEGERLRAETQRLTEARVRLASLMEAKRLTLADRQSELKAVREASAEITRSVTDLSELINQLDRTVTEKTGLGAYEQELKSTAVNPAVASAPQQPTIVQPAESDASVALADPTKETKVAALPPPHLKPQIVELAPREAALNPGNSSRMKPAFPFASARAKLPQPAQGRRALSFGERTQFGGQSKGLVIETRFSAQVTSPCDGWVVYAGEFRSYGQLLIINAGDGYHILLAGMSQIDVVPGQFVLAAEPVGTMSGGQRNLSSAQGSAPVLYVEFRKNGRPIDPDPWWASGQKKVQG